MVLPLALATAMTSQQTNAMDYDQLHQQLDIMSGIIKSSIQKQSDNKGPRLTKIDTHYLSGQGVIFELGITRVSFYHLPVAPVMPVSPRVPEAPEGFENEELFGENFEIIIEEAMEEAAVAIEIANEYTRSNNEEQRVFREQEREIAYEKRDLAREERDLNFQSMHIDKEDKAQHQAELDELKKRKDKIKRMQVDLEKRTKVFKEQSAKVKAEKEKQKELFNNQLEISVSQTLCNYGGGLKALPDAEHVSMIIKGAGNKSGARNKDKVLVFKKSDIKNCVLEKIDAKALLSKANGYQF